MGRAAQYLPWRPHHHHPWKQDSTPGVREPVIRLGTAAVSQAVERIKTDGQLGHFFLSRQTGADWRGPGLQKVAVEREGLSSGFSHWAQPRKLHLPGTPGYLVSFGCFSALLVVWWCSWQLLEARALWSTPGLLEQRLGIQPFPLLAPTPAQSREPCGDSSPKISTSSAGGLGQPLVNSGLGSNFPQGHQDSLGRV